MNNKKKVTVFGMGYVGLTLALTLAKKKFQVLGIEKNEKILKKLQSSKPHFYENGLTKLLKAYHKKNLLFSNDVKKIPKDCKIFIVAVGTPLNKNKKPDLKHLINITKKLKNILSANDTIVFRSTVPIGTIDNDLIPILKNKNINVCYCPERTAQGNALKELVNLNQIISGINRKSCLVAKKLFQSVTNKIQIVKNIKTAEAIKLVDNTQRDTFFSYANEISNICTKLNISSREILEYASKDYPRTKKIFPGPVGGPCLSKDTYLLLSSSKLNSYRKNSLILKSRSINENIYQSFFKLIKMKKFKYLFSKKKTLKILLSGIAFKGNPITDDIRGSISLDIAKKLKEQFKKPKIFCYDPYVDENILKKNNLLKIKNFDTKNFDIVINCSNNLYFKKIFKKIINRMNKNSVIYDFWSVINKSSKILNYKKSILLFNYGSETNLI
tara:strand:- start:150 stop:1475 length:1326 start_codon:yes stop_codon:yes gene_type:complete